MCNKYMENNKCAKRMLKCGYFLNFLWYFAAKISINVSDDKSVR